MLFNFSEKIFLPLVIYHPTVKVAEEPCQLLHACSRFTE